MRQDNTPRQTKAYTLAQYIGAGCGQLNGEMGPAAIGIGIYHTTHGMMCNGCPKMRSRCSAFAKLAATAAIPTTKAPSGETVRQEAARRGISINEVRRQRAAS